jgi:hypothetical protein
MLCYVLFCSIVRLASLTAWRRAANRILHFQKCLKFDGLQILYVSFLSIYITPAGILMTINIRKSAFTKIFLAPSISKMQNLEPITTSFSDNIDQHGHMTTSNSTRTSHSIPPKAGLSKAIQVGRVSQNGSK